MAENPRNTGYRFLWNSPKFKFVESSSFAYTAESASFATTASYSIVSITSSITVSSSFAETASYTPNAVVTASATSNDITFTKGDGSTFVVTIANSTETGSLLTTASFLDPNLTFTKGDGTTFNVDISSLTVTSASYAFNATSASYAFNATSASYAVSASYEIIKEVSSSYADTASFAQSGNGIFSGSFSGSFEGDGSGLTGLISSSYANTASFAQSGNGIFSGSFSGSFEGDGSGLTGIIATVDTGSLLTTASFSDPNLTFTKGDSSTFDVDLTSLTVATASYALNSELLDGRDSTTFTSTASFNSFTSSYYTDSASFDTRITNNSASISSLSSSFLAFSSSYNTGSFSGSFQGDGSDLTNVTASFIPVGLGGIYGGNGTVPLNTTASINGDFTFQGLDEDTRLIVKDGNNGSAIHLFSDGPAGQAGVEFRTQTTDTLLHRIQVAGGDTRYISNNRDLVFSTSTGSFSSGIFITASNSNVGIGTTNPLTKLNIIGDTGLRVGRTAGGDVQYIDINHNIVGVGQPAITSYSPTNNAKVLVINATTDSSNTPFSAGNIGISLATYGTGSLWVDSKQFVGVGIAGPTAKLHVTNTSPSASFLVEDSTNPDATPFVIDPSGNVGIGKLSPTAKLDVSGTTNINGNTTITGSIKVLNGNVNLDANAYFFQGTDTGGTNVSLIGVNSSDQIYIGNQGFTNIIADDTIISGSLEVSGSLILPTLSESAANALVSYNTSSKEVFYTNDPTLNSLTVNNNINVGGDLIITGSLIYDSSITTFTRRITTPTASVTTSDYRLGIRYTQTGSVQILLPKISDVGERDLRFKDEEGNAKKNNITIITSGSDLIDGDINAIMNRNYMAIGLYNDGVSNWYIE